MRGRARAWSKVLGAPFHLKHYRAIWNMLKVCPNCVTVLRRYATDYGDYPYEVRLRTPLGEIRPTVYCPDDMQTINEVFCRRDYGLKSDPRIVVDIGANIGISVLYFLSRDPSVHCYAYEPFPQNAGRLRENVRPYQSRVVIKEVAVGNREGVRAFNTEPTGRYCGLADHAAAYDGPQIQVACARIDAELDAILEKHPQIDLIKIDAEGAEEEIIQAIRPDQRKRIRAILYESNDGNVTRLETASAT